MELSPVPVWYEYADFTTTVLSAALNTVFALLVSLKTPREMKKYKKVFVCICVVDVLYAVTNYIVAMVSF